MKSFHLFQVIIVVLLLTGCSSTGITNNVKNADVFKSASKKEKIEFSDQDTLIAFEGELNPVYRLGEGDRISLNVWNRPELSGKHVVGPDGLITLPLVGSFRVSAMTREEAASSIRKSLKPYYTHTAVTLAIDEYQANKITILGRVKNPGVIRFERPPELLEVLARAGGMATTATTDRQTELTHCAIFRGRDRVIWVDLKSLLSQGNLAYNIRLKPNDLVYIPDSFDKLVYVMGEVSNPGAYQLTSGMTLVNALSRAGGPNENGDMDEIALYRPSAKSAEAVDLKSLLTDQNANLVLEEGDVIYVPKSGLAKVGYVLRQLLPGLSAIQIGVALSGSK